MMANITAVTQNEMPDLLGNDIHERLHVAGIADSKPGPTLLLVLLEGRALFAYDAPAATAVMFLAQDEELLLAA